MFNLFVCDQHLHHIRILIPTSQEPKPHDTTLTATTHNTMIDHLGIEISAALFEVTVDWYEMTLAPLGYWKAFTLTSGSLVGFRDINGSVDW